ncbi:hypothetical protein GHT06_018907 [Daphnia sinensis]|uniref:Uncharacterized protein n=1 Tax=Daphnia sinensis TaxID=1820382 RepID=A0AAD5PSN6_9CRUS|nr:hypothetical protein GHT06_018907 [Daphnia sinensis]
MYKQMKIIFLSYWMILFLALCYPTEALPYYYSEPTPQARPADVSPPEISPNPVEPYPVPPHSVSSYAAPLIVPLLSADYPASTPNTNASTESTTAMTINEEVGTDWSSSTDYVTEPSEANFWILETISYGSDPYEGTTNVPIRLPHYFE